MKYIRTKDGIRTISDLVVPCPQCLIDELKENGYLDEIIKQADTIEELCDFCEIDYTDNFYEIYDLTQEEYPEGIIKEYLIDNSFITSIFVGLKTDKGLIYAAKMNDKGELELL